MGVVLTCLADLVLTVAGLASGATESNPVAAAALTSAGVAGLLVLKAQALAAAAVGWRLLPEPHRAVVPAALAGPWGLAVVWNVHVLVR